MPQRIINLPTTAPADARPRGADPRSAAALIGDVGFSAQLSRAMEKGASLGGTRAPAEGNGREPLGPPASATLLQANDETASGRGCGAPSGRTVQPARAAPATSAQTTQATYCRAPKTVWAQTLAKASGRAGRTGSGQAALQTKAAGGAGALTDQGQDDEKIGDAGAKPDQQSQDLITGLLTLVMLKGAGAKPAAAASADTGEERAALDAASGGAAEPSEAGASGWRASSSSGPSSSESQADNQGLLGALAVLLFSGLEGAIARQGDRGAESAGQIGARAPNSGSTERQAASPARLAGVSPGDRQQTASALSADETQPLAARLFDALKGEPATPSGPGTAVNAEAGLTPAGEDPPGGESLTMRLFGGPGGAAQAGAERWTGSEMQDKGAAAANEAGHGSADAGNVVSADSTPLLESPDRDKPADDAGGRGRSSDGQSWPVAVDASVPATDGSAPQQQASSQPDPSAAIERFDRVMKQASGGAGVHDLTVRLTLGNEERLVLGLKDLGRSVTVEVKASNQGMIDLLQSQRDVIISRLEGKDIYADLVIDPNASGTPEKRDRRETGQSMPGPGKQTGEGFRTFLEAVV